MTMYQGLDGPGSFPTYDAGPNTTPLPDRPLTEAEIIDKLRGTFGLPPAETAPAPAAEEPAEAEKALSWVDRLRVTFGLPPLGSADKAYNPDQPRVPAGDPDGGQWTPDVHSPDRRGRFSKVEGAGLISQLRDKQGFSYQPFDDYSPRDGFMVSPYEERSKILAMDEVDDDQFSYYVNRNKDLLVEDDHFFGGWWDKEIDKVWLDVSIRVDTAEEAHRLGCENNQKAYFDVKRKMEVDIDC